MLLVLYYAEITCGNPGSISHGTVTGNNYDYGHTVSYSCNTHYQLTGSDVTRTCTQMYGSVGYWTGSAPRCACKIPLYLLYTKSM